MKRSRNVMDVWAFLPEFRAVAEVEHLTQAASSLGVTPAALSRTLARLEKKLGMRLFARVSRGLRLLPPGRTLLDATRSAMRAVDTALNEVEATSTTVSILRIGFTAQDVGYLLHHMLERMSGLADRIEFTALEESAIARTLLAGDVDVVVCGKAQHDERLVVRPLGSMARKLVTNAAVGARAKSQLVLPPSVGPVPESLLRAQEVSVPTCIGTAAFRSVRDESAVALLRVSRTRATDAIKRLEKLISETLRECP